VATLTPTEQRRLGVVRPELLAALLQLMDAAKDAGYTPFIPEYGGTRDTVTQARLRADSLRQGGGSLAYPVAKPGTSRHEFGAAFDMQLQDGHDVDYAWLAAVGEQLGLKAGYYFAERGEGQKDPYHFQLNESLSESIAKWRAMQDAGIVTREGLLPRPRSISSSPRPPAPRSSGSSGPSGGNR
jgi:hypothetical protein